MQSEISPRSAGQMLLIEGLAEQRLDDCLAADVQLPRRFIKFLKHGQREVDVDSLNRRHHLSRVGEKAGNVLSPISHFRDLISGWGLGDSSVFGIQFLLFMGGFP